MTQQRHRLPKFQRLLGAGLSLLFGVMLLPAAQQPNIIIILADDLGYSDLGCYGSEIETPHIDGLAANGIRMTTCYNSARCCPTRASLMTGLYPHQAGVGSFNVDTSKKNGPAYTGRLLPSTVTLAEVLKQSGYATYMVGKWHIGEPGPTKSGFDESYGYDEEHSQDQWDASKYLRQPNGRTNEITPKGVFYATDVFNDYALEFIRQGQATKKPWFLYLAHSSPHFPIQAPKATIDKYEARYRAGWDVLRSQRFAKQQAIGLATDTWKLSPRSMVPVDSPAISNGYSGKENPAWDSLPEDRRADLARRMATFAAMVDHVDQGVGRITAHLKETKQLDNTLIIFLSDNGACYEWGPFGFDGTSRKGTSTLHTGDQLAKIGQEHTHQSYGSAWANLGNTPFRSFKHFTHEGGISTSMVVHWPQGLTHVNRWERTPVHVMDIMPTLCEVAQATYPKQRNNINVQPSSGQSFLPVLRGGTMTERDLCFEHESARALRHGEWKIVWGKRSLTPITWELYNLKDDPSELNDLALKHPDMVQTMKKRWFDWADAVGVNYNKKK
jgi:arylsulfatase A-like enzyme